MFSHALYSSKLLTIVLAFFYLSIAAKNLVFTTFTESFPIFTYFFSLFALFFGNDYGCGLRVNRISVVKQRLDFEGLIFYQVLSRIFTCCEFIFSTGDLFFNYTVAEDE